MRRDELPPLFVRVWALLGLPFTAAILAVGIVYVVRGNAGGDAIGAVLIAVAAWQLSLLVRMFAGR